MKTIQVCSGSSKFWSDPLLKPISWQSKGTGRKEIQREWYIEPKELTLEFTIGDIVKIISANKSLSGASKLKNKVGIIWKSKETVDYPDILCIGDQAIPTSLILVEKLNGKVHYETIKSILNTMRNLIGEQSERHLCIVC